MAPFDLEASHESARGTVSSDITGDGDPMVLVHGTPSSSYLWRNVVSELRDDWELYLFDLVGLGQSERFEARDVSLKAHGEVFAELVEHWNPDGFDVAGHDYGAPTVLRGRLVHDVQHRAMALLNGAVRAPWITPFSSLETRSRTRGGLPSGPRTHPSTTPDRTPRNGYSR
jgi:pimeloyl-ACP methyl ester carboxylesterase